MLRRRLVLGVLVTAPRDWKKLRDVIERTAAELDMSVEVDRGAGDNRSRPGDRSHITLIGSPLKASAVAAVAGRIADSGANIDRIVRTASYPVTAIELHVSGRRPTRCAPRWPRRRSGSASTSRCSATRCTGAAAG